MDPAHDDRTHFERLLLLRELYRRRGDQDRVAVASLEQAMRQAMELLASAPSSSAQTSP